MVLLIAGASVVSLYSFNDLRNGLADFTGNDLPKVVAGAKLNQISANLASFAPKLLATNSKGTRQAVLLRVADQEAWLEEILVELEKGNSEKELQRFRELKDTLVENLHAVANLVRQKALNSTETKKLLNRIPKLNKELFSFRAKLSQLTGTNRDYQKWSNAFSSALLLIPTAAASDFPLELQKFEEQITHLLKEIEQETSYFPDDVKLTAQKLVRDLQILSLGENGIIKLKNESFQLGDLVEGTFSQNKIVADRFVASASILTRKLQNNILARSEQLDQDAQDRSVLFLLMSLLGSVAAVLVFFHINKSVIQRLANLNRTMLSHASGQRPPITSSGNDEITDMTKAFKFFVDVIEKREEELEEAKDIAVRADQAKSRFLAAASHDLRQPLHAISLFVATLLDQNSNKARSTVVENIGRSVEHMNDLFESILDYSQLERGERVAEIRSFKLKSLFATLETDFAILAAEKGLVLRVEGNDLSVKCEPLLLDRILRNLLSNAVRYTQEGEIILKAVSSRKGVTIKVQDSGRGISKDQQQQIFHEFYRYGDKSEKGLGLGLAIAQQMAVLLETEITVFSDIGKGAIFSLELIEADRVNSCEQTSTIVEKKINENILNDQTIVLLDDNPQIIVAMTGLLEKWGCNVLAAQNSAELKRLLNTAEIQPLAYVTDYELESEKTGLDVLDSLLTKDERNRGIILTGNTDPEIEAATKRKGFSYYNKPIRPAKLAAFLRHLARRDISRV
ncbi:hybrid sensor histidine kinase/response regulator [Kiloniella sp.]|uniref:ATP-binding response regulator n=1 Tax=Kiloniella sp. TaxID=1938587 RepID=UPI003A94B130